jgi:hypothetical protein
MTIISPTTINASKGFGEVLLYTNTVTSYWMSNMILLAVYIIVLIGFYKAKDDFKGAMAVAGFGTFVFGLLMWIGGFATGWAFGITIGIAIIGTLVLLLDNPQ